MRDAAAVLLASAISNEGRKDYIKKENRHRDFSGLLRRFMAPPFVLKDRTNVQCKENSNCTILTASAALSFAGAEGALVVGLSVEGICELLSYGAPKCPHSTFHSGDLHPGPGARYEELTDL